MSTLSGQLTLLTACHPVSSKDQSQSYTVTAEGTDLSTDMLSTDGDQLQVELDKHLATESGSASLKLIISNSVLHYGDSFPDIASPNYMAQHQVQLNSTGEQGLSLPVSIYVISV